MVSIYPVPTRLKVNMLVSRLSDVVGRVENDYWGFCLLEKLTPFYTRAARRNDMFPCRTCTVNQLIYMKTFYLYLCFQTVWSVWLRGNDNIVAYNKSSWRQLMCPLDESRISMDIAFNKLLAYWEIRSNDKTLGKV